MILETINEAAPVVGPGVPWATIIAVVTVLASTIVGIYTARSARAANRETSQLSGWRDLVRESREEVARLREDREEDQARHKRERDEDRALMESCQTRIDALTRRFEAAERRERALILWAREVVRLMRLADFPFPPPPPGVAETDPDGFRPVPP